ncbi:MAG TPA: GNAT family N-acetyltransferase [Aquabacterium sp.]|uniref:GNAT family N-acetyltransferase n=1 Tax=Aquabacterium sp. TaxID=1872578 RepID=UPI002E33A159|nr:GNAT family N-acetyltransferase [Aquabacterium sp.]HEX5358132.1 GNAT family N-acetyltransferase [Aquabacterium sp.]
MAHQGRRLPTQHATWLDSAWRCLTPPERQAPGQAGLPALAYSAPRPWRLTLPGAFETREPMDLSWDSAPELADMAQALARQSRAVCLPRVPADSPSVTALRQAFAGRGMTLIRPAIGSPYIDLDASWADPRQKFNAGRRSDFRRAERHAEKLGGLRFEIHSQTTAAQLDHLLDEAYAVEARSWKGQAGTALALDPQLGPFHRAHAHAAMQAGLLRLAFMRVGGQAVGMQIALEWDHSIWLLKIGYDAAFSPCSPGNLLMMHTIADAAQRGLKAYEFLGSPAPWTAFWTTSLRDYVNIRFFPWRLRGQLALAQDMSQAMHARLARRRQPGHDAAHGDAQEVT